MWKEEDFLMLSGIQHFSFCRRQWALIHIEHLWAENYRTTDGELMHEHAHDWTFQELRGDTLILRSLSIHSYQLGISGLCDVVEFHRDDDGISLVGRDGLWSAFPVEYKRGKIGEHTRADEQQLCAQAMCLEEMLCCHIPFAALYYGGNRHRLAVNLNNELRDEVRELTDEMHRLYQRGYTPKAKATKNCSACSLYDLCLPRLPRIESAIDYIHGHIEDTE